MFEIEPPSRDPRRMSRGRGVRSFDPLESAGMGASRQASTDAASGDDRADGGGGGQDGSTACAHGLDGTRHASVLVDTGAGDRIRGLRGNDRIRGKAGDDSSAT